MSSNWALYDSLIDGIPDNLTVDECIIGLHWTFVRSGNYVGIAMTFQGSSVSGLANGPFVGKSLRMVASGVKSWDMLQASVGMAACNAWYNSTEKMEALCLGSPKGQSDSGGSVFNESLESLVGKKIQN